MNTTKNMTQEELLDYIIDKFNLTVNLQDNDIMTFINNLFRKIVVYEIITSCIAIIFSLTIILTIVISTKIFLRKKNIRLLELLSIVTVKQSKTEEILNKIYKNEQNYDATIISIIVWLLTLVIGIILIFSIISILSNIYDIIICILFEEKIIMNFIGNYI